MSDSLQDRAEAVENVFFARRDQALLNNIRSEMEAAETRQALSDAIGIEDTEALDALIENDIRPETMLVIGMIPLVSVAWSDGILEEAERTAILQAADIAGVKQGSGSYDVLQSWLTDRPDADLLDSWKGYIAVLASKVDAPAIDQIRNRVMGRAKDVASAAGGFLGLGNKISDSEQAVIDDLTATFKQAGA
jgi:hypothetical protein